MAETIFMIHGMFGGPWCWDNYRGVFEAEGYRCISTTLPYHDMDPRGEPDPRLGTISLLDYADALEQEIKQLDEKPILMGHSMGGLLAQMLGARGLAKAIVLISPASPSGILITEPSVIKSIWSIIRKWSYWKKPARQTYAEAVYSMLQQLPENERKETYDKFVYDSGRAIFELGSWYFDVTAASKVDESKLTCSMLVVAGSQDRLTPVSGIRRVVKKYKTVSTYKEFENHTHWIMAEPRWQEVVEFIADWLRSK
jgi:pimeloyl-ACP methyl ester carboxylesterase